MPKTTHGRTNSRIFRIWCGMLARCYTPSSTSYPHYGGRGITVCDEWRNSFDAFVADMGEPPHGAQLDRIDNNGRYEATNCRWVTAQQNCANRRSTRLLTHGGETLCLTEWAARTGISRQALRQRIDHLGWDLARALSTGAKQ